MYPWAREDLSLKIDEHDQTIWKSTPELLLSYFIQMKSRSIGKFPQKFYRLAGFASLGWGGFKFEN